MTTTGEGAVIFGQMGEPKQQRSKQIKTLMRRNKITRNMITGAGAVIFGQMLGV